MRWLVYGLVAVVVLIAVVVGIGMTLPRAHSAAVRAHYAATPQQVYEVIHDVERGTEWRSGLQGVDVLPQTGEHPRWRETADWGTLVFERVEDIPPRRIVHRIVEEGQGFGGSWTFDIAPEGAGALVTIREDGIVSNPVYRFMTRFVMGYYASLETYAADLGSRLGSEARVERVAEVEERAGG